MFTSVIGTLTSLLPKYFIFGSYVPVLIFSFVNLGMVYLFWAYARSGIEFWLGKSATLTVAVAFVGTVVIAYVISAINDFLREFLEGKYVLPLLRELLCLAERRRRDDLGKRYGDARRHRFMLSAAVHEWEQQLRDAAIVPPQGPAQPYETVLKSLRKTVAIGALNRRDGPLSDPKFLTLRGVIQGAVDAMKTAITTHLPADDCEVESDHRDLLLLIGAILNSLKQMEYQTGTELYTRFGNDPVRPTAMGNIAAAIHAYTIGRYKLELTVFFSRLQTVLVTKEDKGYPLVLDAKAQLDFLVACCWFSFASTITWMVLLFYWGGQPQAFFIVAIAGYVLGVGFYLGASSNYLAYAEVVRASIDVNRFSLLKALDVRLPSSLREERNLWSTMSSLAFSGGDSIEFSFEHAGGAGGAAPSSPAKSATTPTAATSGGAPADDGE